MPAPVFLMYELFYLDDFDWQCLESMEEEDLVENWDEFKEQLIGQKVEWTEDVTKCHDDI